MADQDNEEKDRSIASLSAKSEESDREGLLQARLDALPTQPGCYLFRDQSSAVLYVGKAKSLRSRVRSYFQAGSSDERAFIPWLRHHLAEIETIITATEKEAAILENSLIKEHRPKYNVKLRDDKEFLNLRLDPKAPNARLELVRRPTVDGARYFGPYPSATAARRTLHLVERHFQLRTCSDRELTSRKRPCIQFQIKRCPAPCVYEIDQEAYRTQVHAVTLFLEGRHDEVTSWLNERMRQASDALDFELAGSLRDQVRAIEQVRERQRVVSVSDRDVDVLGLYREGELVELVLLLVRSGRLVDVQRISRVRADVDDAEVVAAFVREQYETAATVTILPDEIWLPILPEGAEGIEAWLNERQQAAGMKSRVHLLVPQRGKKTELIQLAADNARHAFEEKRRADEDIDARLTRLASRLRLSRLPRRIECIDISHLGGNDSIGAVVALLDGKPDKSHYRTYKVKHAGMGDDYGAIFEVLSRRFRRGVAAAEAEPKLLELGPDGASVEDSEWSLPDLFVVDGGRGQLAVALAAAADLGLTDLAIVGLAKEKENVAGDKLVDRVYLPGQKNPIPLRPGSPELYFLSVARDEAHRFANRGREKLGLKRRLHSTLDDVAGIGPKTRKALLTALGTIEGIRDASDETLLAIKGVTRRQVKALRAHLGDPNEQPPALASATPDEDSAAGDEESAAGDEDSAAGDEDSA
ncbi:MAG TPA: excinuclease ABC subunit UvrC, partial [Polyangiaceae bacterium]|nr:excinuclease ABC subunit UvrC [Polyangiaceae bacterium]